MAEDDILRLSDFEAIAEKVNALPRAYDIQAYDLGLTEREIRIVMAFKAVAKVALFDDFKHLNHKIKHHHHVSLSVEDGIAFRENGNRVQSRTPATGMGTTRDECNV